MESSESEDARGPLKKALDQTRKWTWRGALEIFRIAGIPSTARNAEYYRMNLFAEFPTVQELMKFLRGKVVVDIGSGLTHENPYSLINVAAREGDDETLFLGIEPRIAASSKGFDLFDRYISVQLGKLMRGPGKRVKDRPGKKHAIAAEVPGLVLPDESVDLVLSNYFVGRWVVKEAPLLAMFRNFEQVLKVGGEVRLYPVLPALFQEDNDLGRFIREYFKIEKTGWQFIVLRKTKSSKEDDDAGHPSGV